MELKDWALIIGIVAVILAGVVLFGGSADLSKLKDQQPAVGVIERLPQEVEGLLLRESHERVDPIFEGEKYSSMVAFEPSPEGPYAGALARVGAMLYRFESADNVEPALAVLSLGNSLRSFDFQGKRMLKYVDAAARQVTVFWVQAASLVQVLAIGTDTGPDPAVVEAAALELIRAIIALQ